MCEDYRNRELARKLRDLSLEIEDADSERTEEETDPFVLPPPPAPLPRKATPRMLAR